VAELIGALVGTFLFSRVFVWIADKLIRNKIVAILIAYVLLTAFVIVAPAFGNADGGPLAWRSGLIYLPFVIAFLLYDLFRARTAKVNI
jgi:hypothetical protein